MNTVGKAILEESARTRLRALDAALLSFLTYEDYVLSWLVTKDSIFFEIDTLSEHHLSTQIGRMQPPRGRTVYGRALSALQTGQELAATDLYERLIRRWEPILQRLESNNLIVIPHGQLNSVPFSALLSGGEPLGERFAVIVLSALHLFGFVDDSADTGEALSPKFVGVLDPSGTLPRASAEVEEVASHFEDPTVLHGSAANEQTLEAYWDEADVLHFATHAVSDDSEVNAGYISLAGANGSDGRLTVEEVLISGSLRAKLVVLSACSSGAGRTLSGEGVMGFGRAFLAAGANALLVTLWPVEDEVASHFTTAFYDAWRGDGLRLPEAYRSALAATRAVYPSINDWAAFQLIANDW